MSCSYSVRKVYTPSVKSRINRHYVIPPSSVFLLQFLLHFLPFLNRLNHPISLQFDSPHYPQISFSNQSIIMSLPSLRLRLPLPPRLLRPSTPCLSSIRSYHSNPLRYQPSQVHLSTRARRSPIAQTVLRSPSTLPASRTLATSSGKSSADEIVEELQELYVPFALPPSPLSPVSHPQEKKKSKRLITNQIRKRQGRI